MVRIEDIAEVLERYDNWTDWDETAICKLLEVDHHKAGVSQRVVSKLINGMYPGHQHIPFLGQVRNQAIERNCRQLCGPIG